VWIVASSAILPWPKRIRGKCPIRSITSTTETYTSISRTIPYTQGEVSLYPAARPGPSVPPIASPAPGPLISSTLPSGWIDRPIPFAAARGLAGQRRPAGVSGRGSGSDQRVATRAGRLALAWVVGVSVSDARHSKHPTLSASRAPHTNSLTPSLTRPASHDPRAAPPAARITRQTLASPHAAAYWPTTLSMTTPCPGTLAWY
jgi:hypothetical protein